MTIDVRLATIELLATRNVTWDTPFAYPMSPVMVLEVAFPIEFHVAEVAGKNAASVYRRLSLLVPDRSGTVWPLDCHLGLPQPEDVFS